MRPFGRPGIDLSPERVAELLAAGTAQVIHVREAYEHQAGHIPQVRHIELGQLTLQAETIDRDRPVVFYCLLGPRSTMAARAFRRAGWEAYTMDGGITEWVAKRLPLSPEGGYVADH